MCSVLREYFNLAPEYGHSTSTHVKHDFSKYARQLRKIAWSSLIPHTVLILQDNLPKITIYLSTTNKLYNRLICR